MVWACADGVYGWRVDRRVDHWNSEIHALNTYESLPGSDKLAVFVAAILQIFIGNQAIALRLNSELSGSAAGPPFHLLPIPIPITALLLTPYSELLTHLPSA